jgi:hypothetical protein
VLSNIHRVLRDVHSCVASWSAPSRGGSMVTVLRNMVVSSWYQVRGCLLVMGASTPSTPGADGGLLLLRGGKGKLDSSLHSLQCR